MKTAEEWKDIVGYVGIYQISNLGRCRSIERLIRYSDGRLRVHKSQIRKFVISKTGYPYYNLCHASGDAKMYVHRLVAIHFIENTNNLPEVNHKNGNTLDFSIDNLEWCTHQQNCQHSFRVLGRKPPMKGKFGGQHNRSNYYKKTAA